jgi:hypothetical protein
MGNPLGAWGVWSADLFLRFGQRRAELPVVLLPVVPVPVVRRVV